MEVIRQFTPTKEISVDDSKPIAKSSESHWHVVEAWKSEQKCYDSRLTKVLNEIEISIKEQAKSFLKVTEFFIDDLHETTERDEETSFDCLSHALLSETISEPSANAYIIEITAHFRDILDPIGHADSKNPCNEYIKHVGVSITGFVLKYSDGVETEVGCLRGSTSNATVSLLEGEHVTHVAQTLWNETCLLFRPSSSVGIRKVFFQLTNQQGVERVMYFEGGQVIETRWSGGSDSLKIEKGKILRSLLWSSKELKLSSISTQLRPERIQSNNSLEKLMSRSVPSLQELAKEALRKPYQYAEEKKKQQFDIIHKTINRIIVSAQGKLLKKFLEREGRIESLREVCSLEMRTQKTRILAMRGDESAKISCMKSDVIAWAHEKVNLLWAGGTLLRVKEVEDRSVYERYNEELELLQSLGSADKRQVLCKNTYCFRTFIPSHVRKRKRCSAKGCFELVPNCGCTTRSCKHCHTSFCHLHIKSHEKVCLETLQFKCGWIENNDALKPELCGSVCDGNLERCAMCFAQCCPKCSDSYESDISEFSNVLSEVRTLDSVGSGLMSISSKKICCRACKLHSDSNQFYLQRLQ